MQVNHNNYMHPILCIPLPNSYNGQFFCILKLEDQFIIYIVLAFPKPTILGEKLCLLYTQEVLNLPCL